MFFSKDPRYNELMGTSTFWHLFIPHSGNNHRAKLLHKSSLLVYILMLLTIQGIISTLEKTHPSILGIATNISVERLLEKTNQKRQDAGFRPLKISPELSKAAEEKAKDMFKKNYWSHHSPDGLSPWDFILKSNYHYLYAGENLAKDFQTSDGVVDAWIASPSHKANIMRPEYEDIGFAIINGTLNGEETTLVVQMFGTRPVGQIADQGSSRQTLGETVPRLSSLAEQRIPLFNSLITSRIVSLTFALFLFTVFITDGIYLWKSRVFRHSSHTLAHLLFLGSFIGFFWITSLGAIL